MTFMVTEYPFFHIYPQVGNNYQCKSNKPSIISLTICSKVFPPSRWEYSPGLEKAMWLWRCPGGISGLKQVLRESVYTFSAASWVSSGSNQSLKNDIFISNINHLFNNNDFLDKILYSYIRSYHPYNFRALDLILKIRY